jgi:hypothetical protein
MKTYGWWRYSSTFLDLSHFTPGERAPGQEVLEKRKDSCRCRESNPSICVTLPALAIIIYTWVYCADRITTQLTF